MGDIEHDIVGPPMLDECLQLVLDVFGLLSRQPRDWIIAVKSLCGHAVTVLAISDLGLKFALRHGGLVGSFRWPPDENKCESHGVQHDRRADSL